MFSLPILKPHKSYEDYPDYVDEHGQEVRINRKRPNEKQVGRFTIIDELEPHKSYEDYPDYIDEHGQEVRINRKRPNEKQVGRFTIVDDDITYEDYINKNVSKIVGKITKNINLYPNKKVGRFTVKSITIGSPRPRSHSPRPKRKSRSPRRSTRSSRSPRRSGIKFTNLRIASSSPKKGKKIGRFTLTRK